MLNSVEWLTNRILERPSCAWWNGDLWVAHLDLNEQVTVTRTSVQSSPVSASSTGLGFRSSLGPAIAPLRADKLIVAIAAPGQPIRLLASSDGTTFGAPIDLPFVSVMPPALAVADKLWLAWVDEDFGLHLAHSSDAVNFDDEPTPVRVGRPAAIAGLTDPVEDSAIALAWRELPSHAIVLTSFRESDFDPALPERVSLPDTDVDHVAVAFAIGHAAAEGRIVVGCERFEPPQATSADHRIFARQVSRDLAHVCGPEPMPHPGLGPGFARGGGRVWAAWRDMAARADHLVIAPYDIAFGLPPELEALVGKPCDTQLCPPDRRQPCDPPDLRLVCVATDEFEWRRFEPGWIQNARKGDLVITPASGAGIIGGFLKELAFEQRYDHMGIMVDDHRTVRHTTMAHARLKNFYIGSVFGEPAPADGIRPDVVKYGWPGTITQTVQNGFFDGFNDGANPEWVDATAPPPPPEPSGENATDEQKKEYREAVQRFRGFVNPEFVKDGKRVGYAFANLTRSAQFRLDGTVVEPLVVKPPPAVEASDPLVRPTLHRVAEAARTIRGHYRFYGYTEGSIAEMPAMVGPPVGDVTWQNLPAGASWAAGTPALVCSTFIWAAVREASRKRYPNLRLDDRSQTTAEDTWRAPLPRVIADGLYRYHQDERRNAAQALYDHVVDDVRSEVWANIMKLKDSIGWLVAVARVGLTSLLAILGMGIPALISWLGIRLENAQEVVLALNDMPDDVANEICNTFASDQPHKKDDPLWEMTGEGLSVAPHDIIHLWDSPSTRNDRLRVGLWGHHELLILHEPGPARRRKHVYDRSGGLAEVSGKVIYRGTDDPIVGAIVSIGCDTKQTDAHGRYRLEVASGRQEIVAGTYWPASEWWLEGRRLAEIIPGSNPDQDIELEDPPEWRRVLRLQIRLDLVHQVLIGKDDWVHETDLREHTFVKYPPH